MDKMQDEKQLGLRQKRQRLLRMGLFVLIDILVISISAFLPLVLRFGMFSIDMDYFYLTLKFLPIDVPIAIAIIALFKLYNRIWSYASIEELVDCLKAATVIEAIYIAYKTLFGIPVARSFYPFNWLLLFVLLAMTRISVRLLRRFQLRFEHHDSERRIMIIGAGSAASLLIKELIGSNSIIKPVCIIDDNYAKLGKMIHNVPIVGTREQILENTTKYRVDEIVIAIPSASPSEIREIINKCNETGLKVKRLPAIASTISTSLSSTIREINYEDLLGRETVKISNNELEEFVKGKTVMVTGGGGTIGSELCRQIAANKPGKLLIVDIYENTTYELERDLDKYYPELRKEVLIASVRDFERMEAIFVKYKPQIVYHAAAHKHVPLMEYSPNEAIKNNCKGTLNVVKLSDKYNVQRFVLISTDKAVRPTNVMGASKRICEMMVQTYNEKSKTEFVAVRFGNVLGSNGSAIPLFLKQIESGGPVTITHREITRFFMTIPEAVSLVLKAGLMAKGGEIFVLDMGEPVKIYDLACNLIRMKGYEPGKDISIDVIGLRPGEKLYEEMLMDEEGLQSTANNLIHIGKPIEINSKEFLAKLDKLIQDAEGNSNQIKERILDICPTYQPKEGLN